MNPFQLVLAWLDTRPRARSAVYAVVLWTSVLLAVAVWVLPLVDIEQLWRIDVDELGKVAIVTGAGAALLAKRNVSPADGE